MEDGLKVNRELLIVNRGPGLGANQRSEIRGQLPQKIRSVSSASPAAVTYRLQEVFATETGGNEKFAGLRENAA